MKKWMLVALLLLPLTSFAAEGGAKLLQAPVNLQDKVSLQHGAKLFVNYCMGCHALKYLRYGRMADDLGIKPSIALDNLVFTGGKIGDEMTNGMNAADAKVWFGSAPPDLTFAARHRSPDWIYTYLLSFYSDASRPFGDNNKLFHNVAMPDVLYNMRHSLSPDEFKKNVGDITNFLTYAAEPVAEERKHVGVYVLVFLLILLVPVYLMKREFWKDVH